MSEANEMYEGIESVVHDLITDYKNQKAVTDAEKYKQEGAIEALQKLLTILNE